MMMSALYVGRLRHLGHADAQLNSGMLTIDGSPVFGGPRPDKAPIKTDLEWDSHAWLTLGDFIADASLLRTGRSAKAPQRLRRFVETHFGPRQGLYIATLEASRADGLGYETQCRYTDDEIDAIYSGALTFLEL